VAQAQSNATLYGVLDSTILYKTLSSPGGNASSLASGGESTSRWGLVKPEPHRVPYGFSEFWLEGESV
jgi:hypothetical protein